MYNCYFKIYYVPTTHTAHAAYKTSIVQTYIDILKFIATHYNNGDDLGFSSIKPPPPPLIISGLKLDAAAADCN